MQRIARTAKITRPKSMRRTLPAARVFRTRGCTRARTIPPVKIDAALERQLVDAQFPQWAGLPITPVEIDGWDNRTFRLGGELSVRLPSAEPYALQVDKEHRWLRELAPRLPLPIPAPLARGRPGCGYPFAWSVYRWLDGDVA